MNELKRDEYWDGHEGNYTVGQIMRELINEVEALEREDCIVNEINGGKYPQHLAKSGMAKVLQAIKEKGGKE